MLPSYYLSSAKEIDLRKELNDFFGGSSQEIAKEETGVLRKMRRDTDGELIFCPCVHPVSMQPDKDSLCPICLGERYEWDERLVTFYRVFINPDKQQASQETARPHGLDNNPPVVFYLKYTAEITRADRVIELVLDKEGVAVKPYKRRAVYHINSLLEMRSDRGRLEYWKVATSLHNEKFL